MALFWLLAGALASVALHGAAGEDRLSPPPAPPPPPYPRMTDYELPPCGGELNVTHFGCWFHEYVQFHRENRGKPDAKYLIWVCFSQFGPGGPEATRANVFQHGVCAGLADRLRGTQFLTRLAYATKRVLLVYQEGPAPLEFFFTPTLIDWRIDGTGITPEIIHQNRVVFDKKYFDGIVEYNATYGERRIMTMSTNQHVDGPQNLTIIPSIGGQWGLLNSVVARSMYKLSPLVEKFTDAAMKKINISPGEPFQVFHLRLGGAQGENRKIMFFAEQSRQVHLLLHGGTECAAKQLVEYHNLTQVNVTKQVLITDQMDLRHLIVKGWLEPWLSPPNKPIHYNDYFYGGDSRTQKNGFHGLHAVDPIYQDIPMDLPQGWWGPITNSTHLDAIRAHLANLADLGLMMRASCLLKGPSGFIGQAIMMTGLAWGPKACVKDLRDCMQLRTTVWVGGDEGVSRR